MPALSGALLSCAPTLNASTIILTPTLDGHIRSSAASGGGHFVGTGILVGDTGSGDFRYLNGLLQFDLSSLNINEEITSVSLVFTTRGHLNTEGTNLVTFDLYESKRLFSNEADWANWAAGNAWSTRGGTGANDRGLLLSSRTINTNNFKAANIELEFGSTANFVSLLEDYLDSDTQYLNLWLGLTAGATGNRHILDLASSEYETLSYQPQLVITTIPEPGAYALLGLGLLFVLQRSRKKITKSHVI